MILQKLWKTQWLVCTTKFYFFKGEGLRKWEKKIDKDFHLAIGGGLSWVKWLKYSLA